MSEDPKLIIRVINFELVQPTYAQRTSTLRTDRQTDGRTDERHTIAISNTALALRASRGNNDISRCYSTNAKWR